MKVINKPIDVMAIFYNKSGNIQITHIKFEDELDQVHKIEILKEHQQHIENIKLSGQEIMKFKVQFELHGVMKVAELRYNKSTTKWSIFKMD